MGLTEKKQGLAEGRGEGQMRWRSQSGGADDVENIQWRNRRGGEFKVKKQRLSKSERKE